MHHLKTIQAAGVLLAKHQGRMTQLRLLKLLYIANRESLRETGAFIIDDRVVAMEHGPVLSHTYDTIKNQTSDSLEWNRFIRREGFTLEVLQDPGISKLSKFEIELLDRVADDFAAMEEWKVVDHTHKFPEWAKNNPGSSSKAIPFEDILSALGLEASAAEIREHLKLSRELERRAERAG